MLKTHNKKLSEAFKKAMYPDIGKYLQLIGYDYIGLEEHDKALEHFLRSLPYLRNVKDEESLLKSLDPIDECISKTDPKKIDEIFNEEISPGLGQEYKYLFKQPNIIDPEYYKKEAEKYLKIAVSGSTSRKMEAFSVGLNYYKAAMCSMFSGKKKEYVSGLFQRAYDYILADFDEITGVIMAKCIERTDLIGPGATEVYINDNLEIIDNRIKKLKSNWKNSDVKMLTFVRMEYDGVLSRVNAKNSLEEKEFKRAKAEIENSILSWKEVLFLSTSKNILRLELKDSQNLRQEIIDILEKKKIRLPFVYYP